MSMSGGVSFSTIGGVSNSRFGNPINIAINGVIPIGLWFIDTTWQITTPDATTHPMPIGYCISDGANARCITTAGHIIPVGV